MGPSGYSRNNKLSDSNPRQANLTTLKLVCTVVQLPGFTFRIKQRGVGTTQLITMYCQFNHLALFRLQKIYSNILSSENYCSHSSSDTTLSCGLKRPVNIAIFLLFFCNNKLIFFQDLQFACNITKPKLQAKKA